MHPYNYTEHVAAYPDLTTAQRQRLGVEPSGRPLDDDGKAGPKTLSGIFIAPSAEHDLVDTALRPLMQGAREEGKPGALSNNRGYWPALFMGDLEQEMSEADRERWRKVEQGPWCAGFVSWVIRTAYGAGQPQALGARLLTRLWAAKPGKAVAVSEAQAGDLIAWRREVPGKPAAGHIGIVWGRSPSGLLLVLEGNGSRRNGAVGLYGYSLREGAPRGTQHVTLVARRADQD